jgi:hypothetical protein
METVRSDQWRGGVTVGPRCVGGGSERWCGRWRQRRCASGGGGRRPVSKLGLMVVGGGSDEYLRNIEVVGAAGGSVARQRKRHLSRWRQVDGRSDQQRQVARSGWGRV